MVNSLSLPDKAFLEAVFNMGGGYVLDFSNASLENFFNELNIGIYDDKKYPNNGSSDSKANRLRAFWKSATNDEIAHSLDALVGHIEAKKEAPVMWGDPAFPNITPEHLTKIRAISKNLSNHKTLEVDSVVINTQASPVVVTTEATVTENKIQIEIHEDIYNHINQYLNNRDYFHAVEESYKLVRAKLKEITGEEQASEVFNMNAENKKYLKKLFGKADGENQAEKDFFRGVGYLNLTVQFLRNEKAHTPATPLEPNLAIHYISLASLAYDLITRYTDPETVQKLEDAVSAKRTSYKNVDSFYGDFKDGKWLNGFEMPVAMTSTLRKTLKEKWLDDVDFTISYNHTNIDLMRLELVGEELTLDDVDRLLDLPIRDKHGNEQVAGLLEFLQYIQQKYPEKLSHKASDWMKAQEQQ